MRPFVLVLLLHELIDKGYPVFRDSLPAHLLKEEVEKQVYKTYPETETETPPEERKGVIPAKIKELMQEQD